MSFIDNAIDRPMQVLLVSIAILILCVAAYFKLPLREIPNIDVPYVDVETDYPGAAPEEVELLVTRPLERKIDEIDDINAIFSISLSGRSYVGIEFRSGTDLNEKLREVRDKISEAENDLPADAQPPKADRFEVTDRPILFVFVYGKSDAYRLSKIAEDLRDELKSVSGCSSIEILSALKQEIHVLIDPDRLNSHLLSIGHVISSLEQQNLDMPGGIVKTEDTGRLVRSIGRFKNVQEISDTVVSYRPTGPIRIRDVADIEDGMRDVNEAFRFNDQICVALSIRIREKADLVKTRDALKAKLDQIRHTLPPGVYLETAGDMGQIIQSMTDQLKLNAILGGICVLLVLMIGMGLRNSLMISLAIPFSILISCGIIYILGMTLTGVALFSLILALGLVVDGAIIVGENIYRHIEEGLPHAEAAKTGVHEVASAVLCADLTTIIAFLPMMFMSGYIGQYISVIPIVVAGAVAGSLFVDHIVLPTVAAKFMRVRKEKSRKTSVSISAPHLRTLSWGLIPIPFYYCA